jgi:cystathionine gamma-synthase
MTGEHKRDWRAETLAAQAGGAHDRVTGGVNPPLPLSTTFMRGEDYALIDPAYGYARDDSSIVREAESLLARLEGARAAMLFPSGMAAVAALMRTLANGSGLVVQSGIYWGTTKWVREFCARRNIALAECDASDLAALGRAIDATKPALVWIETPSNPWLKTVDIAAAAKLAHAAGALLAVDSTAATPILSRPLEHGADFVMHSATKAINGHSDILAGVLCCADDTLPQWQELRTGRHDAGAIIGNFEAWLLLRGMRTLPLRVERMSANALSVARFLAAHPGIERVLYPGLQEDPGHEIASRQMRGGYGCLMSVLVKGGAREALAFCGALNLLRRATSLGGVESLVEHRRTIEGDLTGIPENLVRISIGIEHEDDLKADLAQALEKALS